MDDPFELMRKLGLAPPPPPSAQELRDFEARCRKVSAVELGHLMFTAPTRAHGSVAARVLQERLDNHDLQEH